MLRLVMVVLLMPGFSDYFCLICGMRRDCDDLCSLFVKLNDLLLFAQQVQMMLFAGKPHFGVSFIAITK